MESLHNRETVQHSAGEQSVAASITANRFPCKMIDLLSGSRQDDARVVEAVGLVGVVCLVGVLRVVVVGLIGVLEVVSDIPRGGDRHAYHNRTEWRSLNRYYIYTKKIFNILISTSLEICHFVFK